MLAAAALTTSPVRAEGNAPLQPYNYLHPPAALAKTNHRPLSGKHSIPAKNGATTVSATMFTGDGQAGLGAHKGAFVVDKKATSVLITITPVNTPGRLPTGYTPDGNAYRFTAQGIPGKKTARTTQVMGMVLRWPRTPFAIYQYAGGKWTRLCDSSTWQISQGLVVCNIRSLGTFVQVHHPTGVKPK